MGRNGAIAGLGDRAEFRLTGLPGLGQLREGRCFNQLPDRPLPLCQPGLHLLKQGRVIGGHKGHPLGQGLPAGLQRMGNIGQSIALAFGLQGIAQGRHCSPEGLGCFGRQGNHFRLRLGQGRRGGGRRIQDAL